MGCVVVATAGCAPEPLFETEPAYAGVTGMWSLPARLGDAQTALVVLAFASASRALTAGARPAGRGPAAPWPSDNTQRGLPHTEAAQAPRTRPLQAAGPRGRLAPLPEVGR